MEGTVLEDGVDKVSIMSVVSPLGLVSVSSLRYLPSVGYYSKSSNSSFPLSLSE